MTVAPPLVQPVTEFTDLTGTLGIAVFAGMLGVTFFGVFLTPVFDYAIARWRAGAETAKVPTTPQTPPGGLAGPNPPDPDADHDRPHFGPAFG